MYPVFRRCRRLLHAKFHEWDPSPTLLGTPPRPLLGTPPGPLLRPHGYPYSFTRINFFSCTDHLIVAHKILKFTNCKRADCNLFTISIAFLFFACRQKILFIGFHLKLKTSTKTSSRMSFECLSNVCRGLYMHTLDFASNLLETF